MRAMAANCFAHKSCNFVSQDAFFQPYLPLQQILMLKASSWLVGTSNSIFRQQKDCAIDVIVDVSRKWSVVLPQRPANVDAPCIRSLSTRLSSSSIRSFSTVSI